MTTVSHKSFKAVQRGQDPLNLLQDIFDANEWKWERLADDELIADISGRWAQYKLGFYWRDDIGALSLSAVMTIDEIVCPPEDMCELIVRINEKLWLGHFDLMLDEPAAIFRYTLLLRHLTSSFTDVVEEVLETALMECDRFFPAFNFVAKCEKAVSEALIASVTETAGEA